MNPSFLPTLLLAAVACTPDSEGTLSCGPGTHQEGDACVVDDADTAAGDSAETGLDSDTAVDTATDSAIDTGSDTGSDTGIDTGSDTDSGGDTGEDTGEDTGDSEPSPGMWTGEYELGDVTTVLTPERAGDYLGWSVDVGGDVDADGLDDLLVSALGADENGNTTGSTYVWTTGVATGGAIEDARLRIDGDTSGNWSGYQALFLPDADGDGAAEVLVSTVVVACSDSSGQPGSVGVFLGSRTGTVDFSDADALWESSNAGDRFGCALASPGDIDGDGTPDFAVGAGGNDEAATNGGAAYLFGDPLAGGTDSSATTRLYSKISGLGLGTFAGSVGDTDGDGLPEVGIGFAGALSSGATPSGVYIYGNVGPGKLYAEDAISGVIRPESGSGAPQLGGNYSNPVSVAGDVNGDGLGDVVVGAPEANDYAGVAYVVYGPLTGEIDLFYAAAKISGAARPENVGYAVDTAHDFDGDGRDDVALGAPGYAAHGSQSGAVGLFAAPSGEVDFADATALAFGDNTNWYAGYDLAISDQTRDGIYDLVVGAVYAPDYGQDAGLLAVLPGGS